MDNHILEEFFRTRKDEVIKVMTIDMTFEAREKIFTREAREEGREEGLKEGRDIEYLIKIMDFMKLVNDGILTKDDAAIRLGLNSDEFESAVIKAEKVLNIR